MPANFGWIWPGRLAAMGQPRSSDVAPLARAGIRAVLTLTEGPPLPEFRAVGLTVRHEPIPDFGAPDVALLARCVAFAKSMLDAGQPVVVHCAGGYGRTGTVLAAILATSGMTPDDAIGEVRTMRPGSIETPEQEESVRAFVATIEPRRKNGTSRLAGRPDDPRETSS